MPRGRAKLPVAGSAQASYRALNEVEGEAEAERRATSRGVSSESRRVAASLVRTWALSMAVRAAGTSIPCALSNRRSMPATEKGSSGSVSTNTSTHQMRALRPRNTQDVARKECTNVSSPVDERVALPVPTAANSYPDTSSTAAST